jgi:hypothetical protein
MRNAQWFPETIGPMLNLFAPALFRKDEGSEARGMLFGHSREVRIGRLVLPLRGQHTLAFS